MATVVLGTLGEVVGGALGGPIGAIAGRALGTLGGSLIDQQIVNALTPPTKRQGPRLTTTDIQTSTEGSVIDRAYGRARLVGQVIWATRFEEEAVTTTTGGKGSSGQPRTEDTEYVYYGNFAVGLCEGPVAGMGRIWADGAEIDQTLYEIRFYTGAADQAVDPLIEAKEGDAPAYRGLAYVVFERLPLALWGNRLPQMSIEVFNPTGDLEAEVKGIAIIAGNEFGFDPEIRVDQVDGPTENRRGLTAVTDYTASLDRLGQLCPALESAMVVLPWFGDDVRAGVCTIRPKVENTGKVTMPLLWNVGGLARADALQLSQIDGRPAYGGTSTDESAIRGIAATKARGYFTTVCPFIEMDVAGDNVLPNPYSDGAATLGQPPYPWRGRITVSPAAGYTGSPDKTGATATQVAAFVGTAAPSDFAVIDGAVVYSGPDEWSYRRFVLHHAILAREGGADAFLIGSEMIGLTQVRSAAGTYPFVTALIDLLHDCRTILGDDVEIGYAADWSEYHSHRPGDGTGDVYFNLDPLWCDADLDFVGIDNYLPLSDWRDGGDHLDFDPAGPTTIYDQAYLRSNVEGGEDYDWYYATAADRDAQIRSPISDGAYGKPWVFRNKDIRGWWRNAHVNRPAGIESGATSWTGETKRLRFTELGCPAVDKGSNQPNVFPDPKSSEGTFPYYSSHARDDAMTRAWVSATLGYWADNNPAFTGDPSTTMLDLDRSHVWCWDARPWPSFPLDAALWGDAPNWQTGHWVSGRLGAAPAPETIRAVLERSGFDAYDIEPIPNVMDGVTTGALTSARDILDALRPAYQFDAAESGNVIRFMARQGRAPVATVTADDLVADPGAPPFRLTRAQETDLPQAIKLRYGDLGHDDQPAGTEARRSAGGSLRTLDYGPPVISYEALMRSIADGELQSAWTGRERAAFALPPSFMALDPGDVVDFHPTTSLMRVSAIGTATALAVDAFAFDPGTMAPAAPVSSPAPVPVVPIYSPIVDVLVDGPLLSDTDLDYPGYAAATTLPFGAGVALYRGADTSSLDPDTLLTLAGTIGETAGDFYSGPAWRWDRVNDLYVTLKRGSFTTRSELEVLNGANALLLDNGLGEWELIQFVTATPLGGGNWKLSQLLRGQRGTEHAMRDFVPTGARIVLVDAALRQTGLPADLVGVSQLWRAVPMAEGVSSLRATDQTFAMTGRARRPLAPSHLKGTRDPGTGDWTIEWVRRTRLGGDAWDVAEVPLGEASEAYRLEVLDGSGTVLRGFSTTTPSQLYAAADQTADFGAPQYSFTARVVQLSAVYGDGIPATDLIWVF